MNDRSLRELLSKADGSAPPPILAADIARKVRRRAHKRNGGRVAGMVAVVVGAGMISRFAGSGTARTPIIVAQANISSPKDAVVSKSDVAMFQQQAAQLEQQAAFHERMVTELLAAERHDALQKKLSGMRETMAASDQIVVEREAAAATLVAGGDEILRLPGGKAAAGERYRSVIQFFPDTRIAPVAQERLKQLST